LAPLIPLLLSGKNPMIKENRAVHDLIYPEGCNIQFDMKLLDIFEELKKNDKLSVRLENDYFRLKTESGRRPLRTDLFEGSDIPTREYLKKGYIDFLNKINELSEEEKTWIGTDTEGFIRELEKMLMDKLYKIPTILSFIKEDKILNKVSVDEIAHNMKEFYKNPLYAFDMQDDGSKNYINWSIADYKRKAIQMPIKHISGSSKYFNYDEINKELILDSSIEKVNTTLLIEHVKDILEYKLKNKCSKLYKVID